VTSGASGGNVTFASGGILQLDSLMAFGGTISGFHLGDAIDLRSLAYTSGTTNLHFSATSDGFGAAMITDPPVSNSVIQTPLAAHH
jgi:hypothetical protein